MKAWLLAARPKTLVAGLVPVFLGSALAYKTGEFSLLVFLCALGGSLCIQIATNFVNDAADFERGADTEERLGPQRMAASGLLTSRALYVGAAAAFAVSFLLGLILIREAGIVMLWIGLVSIFCGVIYTAGPFPLAYLGLGDFFVFIFFGLVAVIGTYFAHAKQVTMASVLLASAAGLHSTALIAINNLRDIPTDIKARKITLAVRMGEPAAKIYYTTLIFLPLFIWLPFAASLQTIWGFLPFAVIPLASRAAIQCFQIQDRREYNKLLARTALVQLLFGVLITVSLVVSR